MVLSARGSVLAFALSVAACGGGAPKPAEAPVATSAPSASEPVEPAPDLSPVGAPPGLFAVGRWQKPLVHVDTIGNWLGIPGHVLNFVPDRYQGLVAAIDADAPIEFAAVLTRAKGAPVDWVASIGLKSLAQAVEEARAQGADVAPKAPGIVSVKLGRMGPSCAAALSLGKAPARLVCSSSDRMLDAQLPFATRGLPTMAFGSRDLELEFRLAPLREGYQKELAGASAFATFLARQLEIDAPRVDRATSDAVKGLAEELLTLAEDIDVIALGGGVDATKGELVLDFDFKFRDQKSVVAGLLQDASRQGPPPESFFALPASAESGGYSHGFDKTRFTGVRTRIAEVVDALLEHEKVGRPARDRARRVLDTYFDSTGARSLATGPASADGIAAWNLQIIDGPPKPFVDMIADLNGLVGDRQVRAALAKRSGIPDKALPKASMVPLRGPGVPAGTRALVLKFPKAFYDGLQKLFASKGLGSKKDRGVEPPEIAIAAAPRGTGTVVVAAASAAEASKALGDFLSGKSPTLRERAELIRFERTNAAGGYFVTLAGMVAAIAQNTGNSAMKASGPSASAPLFVTYEISKGVTRFRMVAPKALFGGLQALVPALIR
jgi:hypothetical protein